MKTLTRLSNFFNGHLIVLCAPLLLSLTFVDDEAFLLFKPPVFKSSGEKGSELAHTYMFDAWYEIEQAAAFNDTPDLDVTSHESVLEYFPFYDPIDKEDSGMLSNKGLILVVDTSQELVCKKESDFSQRLFRQKKFLVKNDHHEKDLVSYPVFLANCSDKKSAMIYTQDGSLIMTMEARNEQGQWAPVESWWYSWCGNSYFSVKLKPAHFIMTRTLKSAGNFRTSCRLKMMNQTDSIYSNTFLMDINRSQFYFPPDSELKVRGDRTSVTGD